VAIEDYITAIKVSGPDHPRLVRFAAGRLQQERQPQRLGISKMPELKQEFVVAKPRAKVWAVFQDIERVAGCLPGASLSEPPSANDVKGQMTVKLGPVRARFAGQARIETDAANFTGTIDGSGIDKSQGSRAKGTVRYVLEEAEGSAATRVIVWIDYTLSGALAQFSRGGVVEAVAGKLTQDFAANLEAELAENGGQVNGTAKQDDAGTAKTEADSRENSAAPSRGGEKRPAQELSAFALLGAIIKGWFARLFGRRS
jgi:uncharacterized protein